MALTEFRAVENAFVTSLPLANILRNQAPDIEIVIAAHSLGNMLVSSAIVDYFLMASRYVMLNVAVAMEAYDESFDNSHVMRNPDWEGFQPRLYSGNLWRLFPEDDGRHKLTWKNRFGKMPNAINYYSPTEDVLASSDGTLPGLTSENGAWVSGEMRKGTDLTEWVPGYVPEAGWGFNTEYNNMSHDRAIEESNKLTEDVIRTNPIFKHFRSDQIMGPNGSDYVKNRDNRQRLLARAIPALSNPTGSNSLRGAVEDNGNLMDYQRDNGVGWPRSSRQWSHSDFYRVAYPLVYQLYDKIVNEDGRLK